MARARAASGMDAETLRRAEAELDAMRQRISTLASDLQTVGQRQAHKVEGVVQERPFMSLAVAFATGLMLGRFLDLR